MAKLTPGQLIRQGRIKAGMSRERLAYKSDVSVSTVSRLELYDRVPNLAILAVICEVVDVPIADVASALKSTSAA